MSFVSQEVASPDSPQALTVQLQLMLLIADVCQPGSVCRNSVEQLSGVISINYPSLSLEQITVCSVSLPAVTCTHKIHSAHIAKKGDCV